MVTYGPDVGQVFRSGKIALAERHPEYALGFQDKTWWSRVTQPGRRAGWNQDYLKSSVCRCDSLTRP